MKPGWSSTRPLACFLPRPLPQHDLQAVFFRFLPRPLPLLACGATQNALRGTCLACHNTNCKLQGFWLPRPLPLSRCHDTTCSFGRKRTHFLARCMGIMLASPQLLSTPAHWAVPCKGLPFVPKCLCGAAALHFWRVPLEILKKMAFKLSRARLRATSGVFLGQPPVFSKKWGQKA
jgi:hypothetical protein